MTYALLPNALAYTLIGKSHNARESGDQKCCLILLAEQTIHPMPYRDIQQKCPFTLGFCKLNFQLRSVTVPKFRFEYNNMHSIA